MEQLRRLRGELITLAEVDITGDDRLHARYLERIPVLVLDGEEIANFFVDEADLRRRVGAAAPVASLGDESDRRPCAAERRRDGRTAVAGVATARLSRYLQVLTPRKMGKETISSHELSDYTHINSTQIRRDLSGFGKFGKRGVGYNVDSLVSAVHRRILRTAGQHDIALFGAGRLGQAIASSDIFADHGFRVVAIFDTDPAKVGTKVGAQTVRHIDDLKQLVEDEDIVVGVLAVPTAAAQGLADDLVAAGVKIIFNYSEALLQHHPRSPFTPAVPPPSTSSTRCTSTSPRVGAGPPAPIPTMTAIDLDAAEADRLVRRLHGRDRGGVGSAILDPATLDMVPRSRRSSRSAARTRSWPLPWPGSSSPRRSRSAPAAAWTSTTPSPASETYAGACSRSPTPRVWSSAPPAPPMGRLPHAAEHRRRALPAGRRRAPVRRAAQQHLQPARPRRHPGGRAGDGGHRPPARRVPTLLAVSANSPWVDGRDSGLHSVRTQTFTKSFPRCGIPDVFGSWAAYRDYVELLVATNSIVEYTQVWWSVRPHVSFGTVEVRICDVQATAAESDLVELIVACVAQTARDVDEGRPFDHPAARMIEENMWRAIRYGRDGNLLDLQRLCEQPVDGAVGRTLTWTAPVRQLSIAARSFPPTTAPSASAR